MTPAVQWSVAILGAYLLGSVPFGFLIGRFRGIDIRQLGSRNIGATNVGRVLGRRWGMLCFALDVLKGALAVLLAGWWTGALSDPAPGATRAWLWLAVAGAVIAGHMFTIFLNFRGGKGVATGFGALLAMWPHLTAPALIALFIWIATLRATRYVSVSSILAAIILPLTVALQALARAQGPALDRLAGAAPFLLATSALAALVIWKHRANIARLRAGTEPKVGRARPPAPTTERPITHSPR